MLAQPSLDRPRQVRSGAIDFLRILGIAAVVAGHVGAWSGPVVRETVYTWHVPLFFFLSGYLWSEGRSVVQEMNKRARTLLLPYIVWLVLVGAWWLSQMDVIHGADLRKLMLGGWYVRGPLAAFWFVTALFFAVVAVRAIQRFPNWLQWTLAVAALVVTMREPDFVARVPLAGGIGVACVVFVLAGREFRRNRQRIRRPLITGLVILCGCAAAILSGWSTHLDLKYAQLGSSVITVLVAIGICASLLLIAEHVIPRLGPRVNNELSTLASCGFMVVLTHAVVLAEMTKLGLAPWLVFAGSLAGPWLLALLILRTGLAPVLLGVPVRRESEPVHESARSVRI
ncbi:acyltransferase family protein [Arthrobacter sp. OAP107]|uniref:acyltransferase family protein n=1 Tax=Arthrobacter sp. OAP107 TaxID=3156445 RepID=UPI003397F3E2